MDTDVIVVGAGAAGIAAALELAAHALRVTVVEGRDRIGGRVMWQRVGSGDVPAALGAEFIHGDAPETSAFMRDAGLAAVPTGEDAWTCGDDGALQPADDDFEFGDIFERVRTLPNDESVDAFLRRFDDDPRLRDTARRARRFVEGFEAADPAVASVRAIADELHSGVDDRSFRPVGSYAPLFTALADRCARAGVDVRLATPVERIVWEAGAVSVHARSTDGGAIVVRARGAIVTVPVGVLHQGTHAAPLRFAPELPAAKRAAIAGLAMGDVVRVTLGFRSAFWETIANGRYRDAAFFRCDGGAFGAFWTQMPLRTRTIVAWAGGPRASAMRGMSAQERIERARDAFGAMIGEPERTRDEFEDGATHDWTADPFACGAYSYVVTGAATARAALGESIDDTLFFAGEATSTDGQGGTVSGAFESGQRAATAAARAFARASTSTAGP